MVLNAIALHLNDEMATKKMPNPVKLALTGFSKSKEKTSSISGKQAQFSKCIYQVEIQLSNGPPTLS